MGGTRFVGPAAVAALVEAGHEVCVAHTGRHEHPAVEEVEHLHAGRRALLEDGGLVERWRPAAIVDTFASRATRSKARMLAAAAERIGAHVVAVSSIDVYAYLAESGLGDGSGSLALPRAAVPLGEGAELRTRAYPGAIRGHDNVKMEAALGGAGAVTVLRAGAIYGRHVRTREAELVDKVRRGERRLDLPDGGVQMLHRVAVERVARAVVAAVERPHDEFWPCNVVDPYDWDYAGLAARVGEILDWRWEPRRVPFDDADHPWKMTHPVLCSDHRLRVDLGVTEPDPFAALEDAVRWLWDRGSDGLRDPAPSG